MSVENVVFEKRLDDNKLAYFLFYFNPDFQVCAQQVFRGEKNLYSNKRQGMKGTGRVKACYKLLHIPFGLPKLNKKSIERKGLAGI